MTVILGETIVRFGTGDIEIVTIRRPGETSDYGVAFRQQSPGLIGLDKGDPDSVGQTTEDIGCFLRFEFSNLESVNVLIAQLWKVREALIPPRTPDEIQQMIDDNFFDEEYS